MTEWVVPPLTLFVLIYFVEHSYVNVMSLEMPSPSVTGPTQPPTQPPLQTQPQFINGTGNNKGKGKETVKAMPAVISTSREQNKDHFVESVGTFVGNEATIGFC